MTYSIQTGALLMQYGSKACDERYRYPKDTSHNLHTIKTGV